MITRLKKLLAISLTLASMAVPLAAPMSASAALFHDSTKEACKGLALGGSTADCDSATSTANSTAKSLISTTINLLSIVIGIIAVIMIIISGLRIILSGGDSNTISSARNALLWSLVGLVIVVFAQFMVRFVLTKVTTPPPVTP